MSTQLVLSVKSICTIIQDSFFNLYVYFLPLKSIIHIHIHVYICLYVYTHDEHDYIRP